jgi:hypothetical protein
VEISYSSGDALTSIARTNLRRKNMAENDGVTNVGSHYDGGLAERLDNSFTYHAPKGNQTDRYHRLRETAKVLAVQINEEVPNSREKSLAITKLEEAIMWANKAIACNE